MKNYLHIETYYSDESCGTKNIYGIGDMDGIHACENLFEGIQHITEEHYSLISYLASVLLQQGSEKKVDTILIFAISEEQQTCMWCVSVKLRKNSDNQYGINMLNMDKPMEKESYVIEYVKK